MSEQSIPTSVVEQTQKKGRQRVSPPERFWACVDKEGPVHPTLGRCWTWTGSRTKASRGYGQLSIGCRGKGAHRYSWELHHGSIPAGLLVLHLCDNPSCVNPGHLFLGTYQDNSDDMVAKGRQTKGEKTNTAILTEEQVREIRRDYRRYCPISGSTALGRKYGVHHSTIRYVISGKNWKHLA